MNKNIGILTFHYANNYGAVLQAYALRKVINSFSDYHAEIINYVPEGYSYHISSEIMEEMRKKIEKFNRFRSIHCEIHTPIIHSVIGNAYDVYLVGSDQIWNTEISEVAADYEYFLPNLNEQAKRIAYSASIGMEIDKIDRALFQKYLPKFRSISLRERSYIEIISELSGMKCDVTLDPTMLLDKCYYESLMEIPDELEKTGLTGEPYILYFWYDLGDDGFGGIETANVLARKYGLTIRHTFLSEKLAARQMLVKDGGCMLQAGIGEFLWYIKNACAVVTNSFHGAVFSILFEKPLYIRYPQIRSCRQKNLVELLQLEGRMVQEYCAPDELNLKTDYKPIFKILEKERKRSLAYIKHALETA